MPALGAALGPREDPEQLEGSLTIKSGKKKKKKKIGPPETAALDLSSTGQSCATLHRFM